MGDLTTIDRRDLRNLETVVETGLATFLQVGEALREIRERQLYREKYQTFEKYVSTRWEMSRQRAYQLIEAVEVKNEIVNNCLHFDAEQSLPANESQYRVLAALDDQTASTVWQAVVEESDAVGEKPTAKKIKQKAKEVLKGEIVPPKKPAKEPPKTDEKQDLSRCLSLIKQHVDRAVMHASDANMVKKSPQRDRVAHLGAEILECLKRW